MLKVSLLFIFGIGTALAVSRSIDRFYMVQYYLNLGKGSTDPRFKMKTKNEVVWKFCTSIFWSVISLIGIICFYGVLHV